ncbi:family M23 zinc metallopeptidase with OapA domain protein [Shewanella sp. NFH-SH190041]|uniref:peptidoglycan DD-metalloendopeptidase family protein n=1 Tax=Shewanella sp. NFH-SH190041 TaxID=2950245 RepID=UPI0021C33E34|nr:peptidoglycan DD-metalloendopeptidase family protein [Shewanella sp. NFH-SH190041]BDM63597.1 family M23 zinc metallopeptidase with OapA domain protein [Shewanella sp. NFH-SH190041]
MGKVFTLFNLLPKLHQVLLGAILLFTLVVVVIPLENAQASRHIKASARLDAPQSPQNHIELPLAFRTPLAPGEGNPRPPVSAKPLLSTMPNASQVQFGQSVSGSDTPAQDLRQETVTVKSGDTLAALFQRAGLTPQDVHQVSQLPLAGAQAKKLRPGQTLVLLTTPQGKFAGMSFKLNAIDTLIVKATPAGLVEHKTSKTVELRQKLVAATIHTNFWNAAVKAGLAPAQIMELATIFGWDIDFALDLRQGDSFALVFDDEYADGEYLQSGDILAAEFINQGERFTAVRYKDGQYYSEDGRSMRKAFLKSPVDFKYVSSNFNPRRLHPVTGQIKAHRGVDYVAAIGTPIKAAGAGRVIASSYNQYNGNYVFIKHNDTYTTKYLHLTKRKVKTGQYVKQGQIIGTLGKTGRVTGAHLHYEFIVNGVHRNPRTVKLPKADPIAKQERAAFTELSQTLMTKLAAFKKLQYAQES